MNFDQWIRPDFMFLVPVLVILGIILKHRTVLSNELIPLILFAAAYPILCLWGYYTSDYGGAARIFDTFVRAGLAQGIAITATSVWIYDAYHGAMKYKTKRGGRTDG